MAHPRKITEKGIQDRVLFGMRQPRLDWVAAISGTPVDSNEAEESYPAGGTPPPMKEVKGERDRDTFQQYVYTLKNLEFQTSVEIPRNIVRRAKNRQVMMYVDKLGMRAAEHWARHLSKIILQGDTLKGYDGVSYFNAAHSSKKTGTTQSNSNTHTVASASAVTVPEWVDAILASINRIQRRLDDQDEPMLEGHNQFIVMVPSNIAKNAQTAVVKDLVGVTGGGQEDNPLRLQNLMITVVSSVRLETGVDDVAGLGDKFVTFAAGDVITPLVRQSEWEMVNTLWLGTEYERLHKQVFVEAEASRNAGYWAWQYSDLVQFSV